ncbi:MAG: efflux RND transporter periplasmic adaptor subunit [Flavobacteriales bacterium]|nr:efflux RND transporter periplasmic adaptor subunit [Flavobacteriales bacterium]
MINRRLFPFILACLLMAITGCAGNNKPQGQTANAPVAVEGYIVAPLPLTHTIDAVGSLSAENETALYPDATGRIISLSIPEGKTVSEGTLLMKIYDGEWQAQLKKVKAQLDLAIETEARLQRLLSSDGVARQEYDNAVLQRKVLEAEEELLKVQIGKTELRAPFDGTVGLRLVSEGAYVNPQTAICYMRSKGALRLDFSVPEKYAGQITPGMEVNFQVEGDTATHVASIIATEQSLENDTRNLRIRARVQGTPSGLLPGAFAQVNIVAGKETNALMVPSQSVIPQARNKLVIVSRGGKATFVPVKTGVRQASYIEITEGLAPGDTIAMTGVLFLRPDAPVQFSSIKEAGR